MKRSRFSVEQIIAILHEAKTCYKLDEICHKYHISRGTYYKWKSHYDNLDTSAVKRLKELEETHKKLQDLYLQTRLENTILQEAMQGKL